MVAPDNDHIRVQCHQTGQLRVKLFDRFDFRVEIPDFSISVCLFEMQIEKVVVRSVLFEAVKFIAEIDAIDREYVHANQPRYPAIHAVDGDRGSF